MHAGVLAGGGELLERSAGRVHHRAALRGLDQQHLALAPAQAKQRRRPQPGPAGGGIGGTGPSWRGRAGRRKAASASTTTPGDALGRWCPWPTMWVPSSTPQAALGNRAGGGPAPPAEIVSASKRTTGK